MKFGKLYNLICDAYAIAKMHLHCTQCYQLSIVEARYEIFQEWDNCLGQWASHIEARLESGLERTSFELSISDRHRVYFVDQEIWTTMTHSIDSVTRHAAGGEDHGAEVDTVSEDQAETESVPLQLSLLWDTVLRGWAGSATGHKKISTLVPGQCLDIVS